METLLLAAPGLLVLPVWLFTLYRIHTGEFSGRYTKRRWFISVLNFWGVLAYWTVGDSQRVAKTSATK